MYGFAHNKNIMVDAFEVYEDSYLDTQRGQEIAVKGDYICTNLEGDQLIMSPEELKAFKQVKVVANPTTLFSKGNSFASEYIKHMKQANVDKEAMSMGYVEMGDINLEISEEAHFAENEALGHEEVRLHKRKCDE